ncbi:hypothetical protein MMC26_002249 [Xylographa opegraphella]|nr:hypothetical protein [Xylographa opegraphella]
MWQVVVRETTGESSTFWLPNEHVTVASLKEMGFEQRQLAVKDQRLLFGAWFLEDTRTLQSYDIRDGFVILLIPNVPPPSASDQPPSNHTPAATTSDLLDNVCISPAIAGRRPLNFKHVAMDCTIQCFKAMVSKRVDVSPEHIRLLYAGKEFVEARSRRGR